MAFICSLLLIRCSDQALKPEAKQDKPDLTPAEESRLVLLEASYNYPYEDAYKEATEIGIELDKEDSKKGIQTKRSIVQAFQFSILDTIARRSQVAGKNDPGVYVFNFSGKNGFAFISGDKRAAGPLGWSGDGTIEEGNEPMRLFVGRAIKYIQHKRRLIENMRGDSVHLSLVKKLADFAREKENRKKSVGSSNPGGRSSMDPCVMIRTDRYCDNGCTNYTTTFLMSTSTTTTIQTPRLLKTNWSQYAPYNNNFDGVCPVIAGCTGSNDNFAAGCVPISEAQILAYFYGRNPGRFGVHWPAISGNGDCNYTFEQRNLVSGLVKSVFDNYLITGHSCETGTFTFNRELWFALGDKGIHPSFGMVQGEFRAYNPADMRNSIASGSPVLAQGSDMEFCFPNIIWSFIFGIPFPIWGQTCLPDPSRYHQFVMDGLQTRNTVLTYRVDPVDYLTCELLPHYTFTVSGSQTNFTHINWGWGYGNGWYVEGAFGGVSSSGGPTVNPYYLDKRMMVYITPN